MRLTERDEYGNAGIIGVDSAALQMNLGFNELNSVTEALNKLADYEEQESATNWTPCAEGLPEKETLCIATIEVHHPFADGIYVDVCMYGLYGWELKTNDYKVLAWQPLPLPWTGDHLRDTTKKVKEDGKESAHGE